MVNQVICKHYNRIIAPSDVIMVKGQPIVDGEDSGTLIFNKPIGLACSHDLADRPLIYDEVPTHYRHPNLQTVGRLDRNTTGLLLLTIDGKWAQRILSPDYQCWKRYRIVFSGQLVPDAISRVERGAILGDDEQAYLPGYLMIADKSSAGYQQATMLLCEGRHHQVKRMIKALGGQVERLHRDRIGGLDLPADIAAGGCRPLQPAEEQQLFDPTRADPHTWLV
jgi:16S rRNA pseudouridine516 synthase